MTSYPSNANNSSTTTVSSSQTLVPAKDYASAFADLQSKYGFGGNAPSPNPKTNTQDGSKKAAALKEEDKALNDEAGKAVTSLQNGLWERVRRWENLDVLVFSVPRIRGF
ncbi:hypothetical protein EDD85DRAFT_1023911 [Armillaria nabsnona]|nr:hypothetical protein EDD85DRAFT_1023911 [Armillaria nabsnona]